MSQFNDPSAGGSGDGTSGLADQAQDKAGDVAAQAKEKAYQAGGQIQERLRTQVSERAATLAEQAGAQAEDLRSVGSSLREQGKDGPAQAADRLASYAERASSYLSDRDADTLLSDAEDFGRRQPWALAAASVAAGFAASRFLKASSRQRYQARAGGGGRTVGRPAGVYAGAGGRSNGAPESTPPPRAGGIGSGMPGAQAGAMAVSPSGPAV